MLNNHQGFSLIELMVVISIIGMLTSMALPTMHDRVIRAQITEAMGIAAVAKAGIEDYYQQYGRMPKNNQQAGLPSAEKFIGNYLTRLSTAQGVITLTLGNRINKFANGKTLTLRPAIVAGEKKIPITWVCGAASVPTGMKVSGINNSTLLPRRMPIDCRY